MIFCRSSKMRVLTVLFYAFIFGLRCCRTENILPAETLSAFPPSEQGPADLTSAIEEAIVNFETTAAMADRLSREGILPLEETEKYYNEMVEALEDILVMLKTPANAYKFLKAKGIDRIFLPNINVRHAKLRTLLLALLKVLFEVVPVTTEAIIPIFALDRLLDIFENDENLGIKAHALDIMYVWLPENPKAQVRVMKLKGLAPFYYQISKLDNSAIHTLLDLFNTILNEHIKIRNDIKQKSKEDSVKSILYQRIGLIERMSTPTVCNGLLNIFQQTFPYATEDKSIIGPVFELIKNIKPYCTKVLRGQTKAMTLFEGLLKHVQNESKKAHYDSVNLNVTDLKLLLEDYVRELKYDYSVKYEF